MQKFDLEIKNEKLKSYRTITLLIVILNALAFIFLLFGSGQAKSIFISLSFILIYTAYIFYISKKSRQNFFFDEWIFFLLMILWVNENIFIAILNLVLFLPGHHTIGLSLLFFFGLFACPLR